MNPHQPSELHILHGNLCDALAGCVSKEMHFSPAFAAAAKSCLPSPLVVALRSHGRRRWLLNGEEIEQLVDFVSDAARERHNFDFAWLGRVPPYLDYRPVAHEIASAIGVHYADRFGVACNDLVTSLNRHQRLHEALPTLGAWIEECQASIRACGWRRLLPKPEGLFPTPTHPGITHEPQPGQQLEPNKLFISDAEAARFLSISPGAVRNMIQTGRLDAIQVAGEKKPRFRINFEYLKSLGTVSPHRQPDPQSIPAASQQTRSLPETPDYFR